MRVLRTEGCDRDDWVPRLCTHRSQPYAILSHRWFEDENHEILFADIQEIDQIMTGTSEDPCVSIVKNAQYAENIARSKPGFKKLQGAARQALKDGHEYIWIDTCCIDKQSSAELSEAINSMFKWYKGADVCYAYLVDVTDATDTSASSSFAASHWWQRGWTLQELLAPPQLTFFTSDWKVIGTKKHLGNVISEIIGINAEVFENGREIDTFCVAQRMSWASNRTTTRPEDIAYCLMGLFDVNMPILYGEGEKAFIRLQEEIMKARNDESIFAWRDEPVMCEAYSGMLATRPAAFRESQNVNTLLGVDNRAPYSMTNKGLSIALPLVRAPSSTNTFLALLECVHEDGLHIGIFLRTISSDSMQFARLHSHVWMSGLYRNSTENTAIYVKQSWAGHLGIEGLFLMALEGDEWNVEDVLNSLEGRGKAEAPPILGAKESSTKITCRGSHTRK